MYKARDMNVEISLHRQQVIDWKDMTLQNQAAKKYILHTGASHHSTHSKWLLYFKLNIKDTTPWVQKIPWVTDRKMKLFFVK